MRMDRIIDFTGRTALVTGAAGAIGRSDRRGPRGQRGEGILNGSQT